MIENYLYQIVRNLASEAINEALTRDLGPLIRQTNLQKQQLLTYTEAREKLHISKPTFFRLLRENRLRKVTIDKKTFRIDPRDLDQFIESQKT